MLSANITFDTKRWAINLHDFSSSGVYFETKKVAILLLLCVGRVSR